VKPDTDLQLLLHVRNAVRIVLFAAMELAMNAKLVTLSMQETALNAMKTVTNVKLMELVLNAHLNFISTPQTIVPPVL